MDASGRKGVVENARTARAAPDGVAAAVRARVASRGDEDEEGRRDAAAVRAAVVAVVSARAAMLSCTRASLSEVNECERERSDAMAVPLSKVGQCRASTAS